MNKKTMFSSATDLWETPHELFDQLNDIYKFNLDVCAVPDNAKCKEYFTPEIDGLKQKWKGSCFMNPPYGREIGKWVKKAYEESQRGVTVVCLLPSRTDTKWFHDFCIKGDITFIKGRLKFGGCKNSAPFPSMIVVFNRG
jgi:phage N-6-adenine-methyltransferase